MSSPALTKKCCWHRVVMRGDAQRHRRVPSREGLQRQSGLQQRHSGAAVFVADRGAQHAPCRPGWPSGRAATTPRCPVRSASGASSRCAKLSASSSRCRSSAVKPEPGALTDRFRTHKAIPYLMVFSRHHGNEGARLVSGRAFVSRNRRTNSRKPGRRETGTSPTWPGSHHRRPGRRRTGLLRRPDGLRESFVEGSTCSGQRRVRGRG